MKVTLDWLGVATYRLVIGELVVYLDAYMDRVPTAPPVGMSAADVDRADYVLVGHSHFDHLHGAQVIAKNTGAKLICSNESARVMREHGVPKEQIIRSQGGERHRLAAGVNVRVFPSLHASTWAAGSIPIDEEFSGLLGLCEDERAQVGGLTEDIRRAIGVGDEQGRELRDHIAGAAGSFDSGGALVYLIETPAGSIFYQDTSGCWSGVVRELRADVAILAASGRGNLDGEPYQGSLAQFVATEAGWLQPQEMYLCHHDDWMPPVTRGVKDLGPVREALAGQAPGARLVDVGYLAGTELFAGGKP